MWDLDYARRLARRQLQGLGDRWEHVKGCGALAEALIADRTIGDGIASAMWLHDIGYARKLRRTGFHSIDGALYLRGVGAPTRLVGLVAHHTGAIFEAEERDLLATFASLPVPDPDELDAVTLIDLSVGPCGELTTAGSRLTEIRDRYAIDHVVHRAILRSSDELLESAARARHRLGLPDDWPLVASKRVCDAEPHRRVKR